ncbi:MAG: flagellin lysine-N-methylase, partial [Lachnospiraceae bacterium]|nr:flagellin lysine-N-methylase [Lachnospiraceae bacterium]
KHFRLLLCNEIYSELVLPETECLEDLIVKLEWMALECAVLQHSLFLTFVKDGHLTFASVRECVYIIIRMTGYSDDDIWEYMENSFDDIRWPWWYFNEIV